MNISDWLAVLLIFMCGYFFGSWFASREMIRVLSRLTELLRKHEIDSVSVKIK